MASFDQNLIIFEDDTLLLQYVFTDLEENIGGSWALWWGACKMSNWPSPGTPAIEKARNWTTGDNQTPTNNNEIGFGNNPYTVNVFFTQADFEATAGSGNKLETDEEYYTELVVSDNANEDRSLVAATGKLFISSSMFSIANYRP